MVLHTAGIANEPILKLLSRSDIGIYVCRASMSRKPWRIVAIAMSRSQTLTQPVHTCGGASFAGAPLGAMMIDTTTFLAKSPSSKRDPATLLKQSLFGPRIHCKQRLKQR